MDLCNLYNLVGLFSDLLGLLNDLLSVLLDLFLLSLDHFLEVFDLLGQGSLLSLSFFLNSLSNLSRHLGGSLRGGGGLNRLSLLFNLLSFFFDSLYLLIHFSDFGSDNSLIILSFLLLGGLSLNDGSLSLNGGFETSDFIIDLSLLSFALDDCSLFFELLDLLLGLGDSLASLLDSLLRLDDDNFMVVLSLSVVSLLVLNLLFDAGNSMSVGVGLSSDCVHSMGVRVLSVSLSNSIDGSSLSLFGYLNGVGGLSPDSNVVGVVCSPGGIDSLDGCLDRSNLRCVGSNLCLVSSNLTRDALDFRFNSFLFSLFSSLKLFFESSNSGGKNLKLRFGSGLKSLLFIKFSGPFGGLFFIFDFLGAVLLLSLLLNFLLSLNLLLLVHNIGSFNTLFNESDSLLLSFLSFLL